MYGTEVASLYDQERELEVYQLLASYQIAPHYYGNGTRRRFVLIERAMAILLKSTEAIKIDGFDRFS